jgi:nitrogen regulatory protein PII
MRYSLESEVALYNEEEKNMEHRDKEFELWLAHQMEKYEYIIEDLREVKREGNKGDNQVMVVNYVIL